jgi:hypothetical protein
MSRRLLALAVGCVALLALVLQVSSVTAAPGSAPATAPAPKKLDPAEQQRRQKIEDVHNTLRKHNANLFKTSGVVASAVGFDDKGNPVVKLYTKGKVGNLPKDLDGKTVIAEDSGEMFCYHERGHGRRNPYPGPQPEPDGGTTGPKPTSVFPRPVPIGVSTGNEQECSAGTISCRVTDGTNVYALSNNHVYALENGATMGSAVLQPGLYDTKCAFTTTNVIGHFTSYVPISFTSNNTVDCALATTTTDMLGKSTPSNGYGTPASTPIDAVVGMAVQKYGRTTALTKGTISGIHATANVTYSAGTATFVDQIIIQAPSRTPFSKAGDSGSLIVTNDANKRPVGLLFAGNSTGTYTIANRIDLVLQALGVTIDGN